MYDASLYINYAQSSVSTKACVGLKVSEFDNVLTENRNIIFLNTLGVTQGKCI